MAQKPRRLAAIDIGTNSIHMIIVEVEGRGYRIIDKEKDMVQLGRGSLGGDPLTEDSMMRAVTALTRMVEIARNFSVNETYCVATSAVREAPNRHVFRRRVKKATGLVVSVISGEREADLIFSAVRAGVDFGEKGVLCIDIGGGSVEFIVGTDEEVFFAQSLPLGALRLTQKFFGLGAADSKATKECRRFVRKRIKKTVGEIRGLDFDHAVGTSGTILTLAGLAAEDERSLDDISATLRWLEVSDLEALTESFSTLTTSEIARVFQIEMRRAESIVAGGILLEEVLRQLHIPRLLCCTAALREGMVIEALRDLRGGPADGSVRRTAVAALADKSRCEPRHASHVAKLALRIFDQTGELHALGESERELLEYTALLHEAGIHVSYQRYHKHSYYLIRHSGLEGFTDRQIAIMANVARYHRRAEPIQEHGNFAELTPGQREIVRRLGAILRIAVGLDRTRRQAIQDVVVSVFNKKIELELRASREPDIEIEYAKKGARYFSRLFDYKVSFSTSQLTKENKRKPGESDESRGPGDRPEWVH